MAGHEQLELSDELTVPAVLEGRVESILHRDEAQLVEPTGIRLRERLGFEVGERRTPPDCQRLGQRAQPFVRLLLPGLP